MACMHTMSGGAWSRWRRGIGMVEVMLVIAVATLLISLALVAYRSMNETVFASRVSNDLRAVLTGVAELLRGESDYDSLGAPPGGGWFDDAVAVLARSGMVEGSLVSGTTLRIGAGAYPLTLAPGHGCTRCADYGFGDEFALIVTVGNADFPVQTSRVCVDLALWDQRGLALAGVVPARGTASTDPYTPVDASADAVVFSTVLLNAAPGRPMSDRSASVVAPACDALVGDPAGVQILLGFHGVL